MAGDQYVGLVNAVRTGDVDAGKAEAKKLAESGIAPEMIFRDCIEPELTKVGEDFSKMKIFLPEMVAAADVSKGCRASW